MFFTRFFFYKIFNNFCHTQPCFPPLSHHQIVTAHMCSAVDVRSEPHRFVPGRAPPRFTRYVGRVGRDAGLSGVHVAVHFDGVLHTALVRIHPELTYTTQRSLCGYLDFVAFDDNVDLYYSCFDCSSEINQLYCLQAALVHSSDALCSDNISRYIMLKRSTARMNRKNKSLDKSIIN